jgi:small subunit ribosomal protein S6
METTEKKLYEAMFLVDSAQTSDWDKTISILETVLKKVDGEIVSMKKWSERKLAYDIKGKSRGTYILCYFRADGERIKEVETAVQLSEQIMRVLILCAEDMDQEHIEKETPDERAERQSQPSQQKDKEVEAEKEHVVAQELT